MFRRLLACSALLGAVACGEPQPPPAPVTLRVGASGLSSFRSRSFSGDTAHAMELVYALLREHATIEILGPTRVALRAESSAPGAGAFLCERLLDDQGVIARTPAADTCVLDFISSEALDAFEGYPWLLLDHGPFRWERELDSEGRVIAGVTTSRGDPAIQTVELASRDQTGIDRIKITAMPLHEAWRRLFARQLDVIPNMSWLYRPHFAGMHSVRTIDIAASSHMHLFFNTRLPAWADADLRRHVASIVEPAAVAATACGDPACAVRDWKPAAPSAPVELPPALTIRVLSSESSAVTAAHALSYRLRLHHKVEISVEPVSIATLVGDSAEQADYALVLAPMGLLSSSDPALLLESLAAFAGYESPAFIAAAERGDATEMQRILEEDVPSLPLYEMRTFAAVDARFCGGEPTKATSWAWLADLHPCPEDSAP
jgi:hypothetical protein